MRPVTARASRARPIGARQSQGRPIIIPTTYLVAGAAVLFVLLAASDLYIRLATRRRLEPLIAGVRALRRTATQPLRYRPLGPHDPGVGDARPLFEAATLELVEQGLTVLGDMVEEQPDGTPSGVTRWFVDASRTVCGWFGVVRSRHSGAINPVMMLFSESDSGEFFVTGRGGSSRSLARPPGVHRTFYTWHAGLARVLAQHRADVAQRLSAGGSARGGGGALRAVEAIDEAVAMLTRLREATARWRASQPPLALLTEDVRSVLQERYEELGPRLIRVMTARGD